MDNICIFKFYFWEAEKGKLFLRLRTKWNRKQQQKNSSFGNTLEQKLAIWAILKYKQRK